MLGITRAAYRMPKRPFSKAATSEDRRRTSGRTVRRIRSTTFVRAAELVRRPGPVEDLNDARTKLTGFFSILF